MQIADFLINYQVGISQFSIILVIAEINCAASVNKEADVRSREAMRQFFKETFDIGTSVF